MKTCPSDLDDETPESERLNRRFTHAIVIKRKFGEDIMYLEHLPIELGVEPILIVFHRFRFVPDTGHRFSDAVPVVFGSGNKILKWGTTNKEEELADYSWSVFKVYEGFARGIE